MPSELPGVREGTLEICPVCNIGYMHYAQFTEAWQCDNIDCEWIDDQR